MEEEELNRRMGIEVKETTSILTVIARIILCLFALVIIIALYLFIDKQMPPGGWLIFGGIVSLSLIITWAFVKVVTD